MFCLRQLGFEAAWPQRDFIPSQMLDRDHLTACSLSLSPASPTYFCLIDSFTVSLFLSLITVLSAFCLPLSCSVFFYVHLSLALCAPPSFLSLPLLLHSLCMFSLLLCLPVFSSTSLFLYHSSSLLLCQTLRLSLF